MPTSPTTESLLAVLPKPRIVELGRTFGVAVLESEKKEGASPAFPIRHPAMGAQVRGQGQS